MSAYYNEHDENAAQWLRNLIAAGHIAPGDVDTRSIEDVHPDDLKRYTQCHFFAGIGVWSHALRSSGWPDDRPIWTGSCPCQPFSAAGKGGGFADERHLWPAFFHLIEARRPVVVLGEQVASRDGLAWLDLVQADLEGAGYTFGGVDTCAAGFGAPHIRQRLYWMAHASGARTGRDAGATLGAQGSVHSARLANGRGGDTPLAGGAADLGLGHPDDPRLSLGKCDGGVQREALGAPEGQAAVGGSDARRVENPELPEEERLGQHGRPRLQQQEAEGFAGSSRLGGWWRDADWIFCTDQVYRPVEPGTFPLAHGASARVVRLRAYGNALVAPQAIEFCRAARDAADLADLSE